MSFSWTSYHPSHAIQQVTASIGFKAEVLDDEKWKRILKAAHLIASEWGLQEVRPLTKVDVSTPPHATHDPIIKEIGLEFLRMAGDDNYIDKLTVTRTEIEFNTWNYVRWAGFAEMLSMTLIAISNHFTTEDDYLHVALEYTDVYNNSDVYADAREIININSKLIAEDCIQPINNWQTNCSYFVGDNENMAMNSFYIIATNRKQLGFMIDDNKLASREIKISTAVASFHRINAEIKTEDTLASSFETLHIRSKRLLRSILTDEAANIISLGG